ncbi:MAG: 30S ribosomal protein S18, partial [Candidatus Levybacteria bacterium]|nr:30S ribosomal protein S18 [Candidatus Levybacteria bacterium]
RSGLCTKHQKKLTVEVKHARHLALLPFVVRV